MNGSNRGNDQISGAGAAYKLYHRLNSPWIRAFFVATSTSTSFKADLVATNCALEIVANEAEALRRHVPGDTCGREGASRKIYVITDGRSVLEWINKYLKVRIVDRNECTTKILTHPAFKGFAYQLRRLSVIESEMELHWFEGHTGIRGNVLADSLARKAVKWYLREHGSQKASTAYKILSVAEELRKKEAQGWRGRTG